MYCCPFDVTSSRSGPVTPFEGGATQDMALPYATAATSGKSPNLHR